MKNLNDFIAAELAKCEAADRVWNIDLYRTLDQRIEKRWDFELFINTSRTNYPAALKALEDVVMRFTRRGHACVGKLKCESCEVLTAIHRILLEGGKE